MIDHVRTVGFKGFDINEDVPLKVIYHGNNKSGKSTRAGAIALALYGHIPFSTTGKKAGDILSSFGNDSLIASVKINGKEFARKYSRNAKGSVSQIVQIDKKKVSSENFAIHLNRAGSPKIADTAEFMKQSEAKKIDTLFELFPNDELSNIDIEIEEAKEDVSKWNNKITGVISTVKRLTESKTNIELPSGSIAEVQEEIKSLEAQISDVEEEISQDKIEQAKVEGEKKGKKEAEQKSMQKIENAKQQPKEDVVHNNSGGHAFVDGGYPEVEHRFNPVNNQDEKSFPHPVTGLDISIPADSGQVLNKSNPVDSIQTIIDAMTFSGCSACAALIVAKMELKKFKGVQ